MDSIESILLKLILGKIIMLDALKPTVAIEAEKDVIVSFGPWETNIYKVTVEQAYLDITASGAWMFNAALVGEDGRKITFSECIASAKTGTLKTTYTAKDGKEVILPGYAKVLNVMHIAVDSTLADLTSCEVVTKAIKIRQKNAEGQMVDAVVEKPCFVDLVGKTFHAGIQKVIEDKFKKNESTGAFNIPNGTREVNTFEKFFDEERRTLTEMTSGSEPKFAEEWVKTYGGKTRNKAKNQPVEAGNAGAPAAPNTPATAPLSWS